MRTPVAVGLLGLSAVGVLTLGLSMAWGDEPGEDFGDAVVATSSVVPAADPSASASGVETIDPTPTGEPSPSIPAPDPNQSTIPPVTPPPANTGGAVVNVPPAGAVEVGGNHGSSGSGDDDDDDDDDRDDDSDDSDDSDSDGDDDNT